MQQWFVLVAIALLTPSAIGYGTGAPPEACENLTPQHGLEPQKTKTPYTIKLSKSKIQPGESVDIVIAGKRGESFKGFLVQARVGNIPIGAFSSTSSNVKLTDCGSGVKNAATHANPSVKNEVRLTWTAPNNLNEAVQFYYTVAKDGKTYWVGEKSKFLTVGN